MTAPVRIEAKAWGDVRFVTLARLLGLAKPEFALILVAKIWSWQTENYQPVQPTYVVDRDTIESVLGAGGPEALVRAKLAVECPEGWRMRGTEGSIEWCHALTEKRARAGKVRADKAKRGADGRLLGNGDYADPAHAGHAGPAPSSMPPAQSSAPAPDPVLPEEEHSPARAAPPIAYIAPAPLTQVARDHADRKRGVLAKAWANAGVAFRDLQAEGIDPTAPNMWAGLPAASSVAMKALIAIVEELLLGEHPDYDGAQAIIDRRIAVAAAEARRKQTLEYMTPARMWRAESFAIAAAMSPEQAARGPRDGPGQRPRYTPPPERPHPSGKPM